MALKQKDIFLILYTEFFLVHFVLYCYTDNCEKWKTVKYLTHWSY